MDVQALIAHNTPRRIEREVADFAFRHPRFFSHPPVSMEDLIQEALTDVKLDTRENLVCGARTQALVCRVLNSSQFEILIDAEIFDNDFEGANRCLAEEVGHILFHKPLLYTVKDENDFLALQRSASWPLFEAQAKQAANSLRMPADLVVACLPTIYQEVIHTVGFGDVSAYGREILREGARMFYVSPLEFAQRLSQLPANVPNQMSSQYLTQEESLIIRGHRAHGYQQQYLFELYD